MSQPTTVTLSLISIIYVSLDRDKLWEGVKLDDGVPYWPSPRSIRDEYKGTKWLRGKVVYTNKTAM
jgi:hypothetical protein